MTSSFCLSSFFLSLILHKSVATEAGAGEFLNHPGGANSEVINKCSRLCGFAKRNEITLVVSVDGKYHPMRHEMNNSSNRFGLHVTEHIIDYKS